MHIPVTDAFDESDQMEKQTVELSSEQIDWLKRKAEAQGLSVDHVLRSILTAEMRKSKQGISSSRGDGSAREPVRSTTESNGSSAPDEAERETHSIVDSLRSANEQLQDLTDDDTNEPDSNTVSRLQARVDSSSNREPSTDDGASESALRPDQSRSMFDMVED